MIGGLRFLLAVLVVANHLWLPTANKVGAHAVVVFYMISGYLMARVIQCSYGLSLKGGASFLLNRFLRIFPPYWLFLALSLIALLEIPQAFLNVNQAVALPASVDDLFRNFTLIDLVWSPVRVIPPAWSLSIEFFFYIAMVLLLARSRAIALTWFLFSTAYSVYLVAIHASFADRYYPPGAASLFFSLGAIAFFFWPSIRRLAVAPGCLLILIPLFAGFPLLVERLGGDPTLEGYYGGAILGFVVVVSLLELRPGKKGRWRAVDAFLGDLSYPLFISHFLSAGLVLAVWRSVRLFGFSFWLCSLSLSIALSIAFVRLVQDPLNRLRDRVRRAPSPGALEGAYVSPIEGGSNRQQATA